MRMKNNTTITERTQVIETQIIDPVDVLDVKINPNHCVLLVTIQKENGKYGSKVVCESEDEAKRTEKLVHEVFKAVA